MGARNQAIQVGGDGYLDVSAVVPRLQVPSTRIDRSMGDLHPGGNPHFACDPRAGAQIAAAIAEKLMALDPANAEAYRAQTRALIAELERIAQQGRELFHKLPPAKRRIVAYHDSLVYLTDWLGLEQVATVEPKPGIPPNPSHVAKVLKAMKAKGTRVILQEEFYPRNTSHTLVQLTKGRLVVLHSATRFRDQQRYADHIRKMIREVFDALAQ